MQSHDCNNSPQSHRSCSCCKSEMQERWRRWLKNADERFGEEFAGNNLHVLCFSVATLRLTPSLKIICNVNSFIAMHRWLVTCKFNRICVFTSNIQCAVIVITENISAGLPKSWKRFACVAKRNVLCVRRIFGDDRLFAWAFPGFCTKTFEYVCCSSIEICVLYAVHCSFNLWHIVIYLFGFHTQVSQDSFDSGVMFLTCISAVLRHFMEQQEVQASANEEQYQAMNYFAKNYFK